MRTCLFLLTLMGSLLTTAACDRGPADASAPRTASPASGAAPKPGPTLAPQQEEAVRAAFTAYQTAILNSRGAEAADCVSQETLAWYESMRIMALTAPEADLRREGLMNRFQVILLRQRVAAAELAAMDGRALFIHAVDQGWVGKNSASDVELGPVTINENFAKAAVVAKGETTPLNFQFAGENGVWKLNLLHTMKVAEPVLHAQAKQLGLGEDEFILQMTEAVSGRKVPDTIWQPLKP